MSAYEGISLGKKTIEAFQSLIGNQAKDAVFVAKSGTDDNSGMYVGAPKLTISSAITAAAALSDKGGVFVLDAGRYAEDLTLQSGVYIHAPLARLVGDVTLVDDSYLNIGDHYATAGKSSGGMVTLSGDDAKAYYWCDRVMDTRGEENDASGILGFINGTSGGILHCGGRILYVGTDSGGISDTASGFGHVHFLWNDIYLAGNNALGLGTLFANTDLIGRVDHILETGSPTGTTGISITAGECQIAINELIADTAYSCSAGTLHIVTGAKISGTTSVTGTGSVTTVTTSTATP